MIIVKNQPVYRSLEAVTKDVEILTAEESEGWTYKITELNAVNDLYFITVFDDEGFKVGEM